jgi:hypothetical protein
LFIFNKEILGFFELTIFFCSTLSEFKNFFQCERILINVKMKRQANFKDFKRFGVFKELVGQKNVIFSRGPLKRSFHSLNK